MSGTRFITPFVVPRDDCPQGGWQPVPHRLLNLLTALSLKISRRRFIRA